MLETSTKKLAKTVLEAAQEIKGKNIVGLDLSESESYTDFILIVSGGSDRQTSAIADNIIRRVFEKHRIHPLGTEGYQQAEWVLIDFGEVIAHVFFDDARRFYHLEDMWLNVTPISEEDLKKTLSLRAATPTTKKKSPVKVKKVAGVRKTKKS